MSADFGPESSAEEAEQQPDDVRPWNTEPVMRDETAVLDSWSQSVTWKLDRSRRTAWTVAAVAAAVSVLLALCIVLMLPLRTIEPHTLLIDRQTGNVERLAPLDEQLVGPEIALTRSMAAQYVVARERFSWDNVQENYRKVGLWSVNEVRREYTERMQADDPRSPLAFIPQGGRIEVDILSVSSIASGRSVVRFSTMRTDPGAETEERQHWAATIDYEFSGAVMSEEDRLLNPLGFQVTRYRRMAETLPEAGRVEGVATEEEVPAG